MAVVDAIDVARAARRRALENFVLGDDRRVPEAGGEEGRHGQ